MTTRPPAEIGMSLDEVDTPALLVDLDAIGVCVQKVSEAEAMVYGGVRDVLVTNEVVGRQKLRRLMGLAHTAHVGVCVDDPAQVADLDAAAAEAGVASLPVHVE